MMLEDVIKAKIECLETIIEFRDTDDEWREAMRDGRETNKYFWCFMGEQERYEGRLEALRELIE